MLTPSKRQLSLYTLPLVVLIGFASVIGLAAWQRSDVIADLTDQVAHGEKTEATAAVRQLAAIPNPPLAILVEAAAADERATAEAGQVAINKLLGQWQRQVDQKQHVSNVASQVTELSSALAAQRQAFSTADFPWLASITRKMLRIAKRCPAKKTPLLAMHCDEIMTIAERNTTAITQVMNTTSSNADFHHAAAGAPPTEIDLRRQQQQRLERDFAEFPSQRMTGDAEPAEPAAIQGGSPAASPANANPQIDPSAAASPNTLLPQSTDTQIAPLRPDWAVPLQRIAPAATPKQDVGTNATTALPKLSSDLATPAARKSTKVRALLTQWLDANDAQRSPLRDSLSELGFRRLSPRVVRQYLSADPIARTRIVDTVLTEPGVDPRPWLLLLSEDEDADVRLQAVSVMATSDDKVLVAAAMKAAVADGDPRIADLAERLRSRLR